MKQERANPLEGKWLAGSTAKQDMDVRKACVHGAWPTYGNYVMLRRCSLQNLIDA